MLERIKFGLKLLFLLLESVYLRFELELIVCCLAFDFDHVLLQRLHLFDKSHGLLEFLFSLLVALIGLSLCLFCLLQLLAQVVVLLNQVINQLLIVLWAEFPSCVAFGRLLGVVGGNHFPNLIRLRILMLASTSALSLTLVLAYPAWQVLLGVVWKFFVSTIGDVRSQMSISTGLSAKITRRWVVARCL